MKNTIIPLPAAQHRNGFIALTSVLIWAGAVFICFFSQLDKTFHFWGLLFNADAFPVVDGAQWFKVWGESLKAVLTTILVVGATWVLGRNTLKVVSLDPSDSWVRFGFEFGFGVVALGFFWVGMGFCGLWYASVWQGFAAVLVLGLAWEVFHLFRRLSPISWNPIQSIGPSYMFLFFAGLVYVGLTLLVNLTPETFYDSMVYHLAVPEYWLSHHGLSDFPTNFFSNYPYGAETYFLSGLVFQGTESAKMLHAVALGICALLAGGWARELGGPRSGYLTLGLVLTLPHFAINTWTTQVEGFLALAVVLFIYALNRWAGSQTPQWAFAAGLFAGLAVVVKYNGAIVIVAALAVLIFQKNVRKGEDIWKPAFLFAAAFLFTAGPWVLKNWIYTGNPAFPYFTSLFQGRHLPLKGYERLLTEQQGRMTDHWWDWLILPWKMIISNPDSYSFAGPIALAFLPLLFLFKLKHPTLRFLVWVSLLVFLASVAVTHILRFMLPDFVLLYILLGAVLASGDRPAWGKGAAWIAGFSAILCFGYMADMVHYYYDFAGIFSGRQTRDQYLTDSQKLTSYYEMAQWLSAHLPEDKRLLIVGDARGLYYKQPFLTNTVFDDQTLAKIAREETTAQGIADRLREMGVDYLVVNGLEGIRVSKDYDHYDLTTAQWKNLDEFIQRGTQLIYSQNLQAVYGILAQLKEKPKEESADLVMFFAPPASQYLVDVEKRDLKSAESNLNQTLQLYPFSVFWKKQKNDFEKHVGNQL